MPKPKKIVVIDCQVAGVAGDMLLGALIDAGADVDKIVLAIESLGREAGYEDVKVEIKQVLQGSFGATSIDVTTKTAGKKNGKVLIEIVEKTAEKLGLSEKAQQFASNAVRTLVEAEATLHKTGLEDAHLHEVGLIDTPAEIIGVAVAADDLGVFEAKIYATPVSVGGGLFEFSHGTVSSPAPATLTILQSKNFLFKGGPIQAELATPTGAAILVNLAEKVTPFYPPMAPLKVGYGAGTKKFKGVSNVLRVTLGTGWEQGLLEDGIAVLETNVDDVTGETVGYVFDRLLQEGAKDVCIIPMFTKKNRPGQIIKVIADPVDVGRLSRVLVEETGTLGVRMYPCQRHITSRETLQTQIQIGEAKQTVKVKVSKDSEGNVLNVKAEYEDAKQVAQKTGMPLREICELAVQKAKEQLK
ncbi:MAG: nickel pincer cofactor biosynthesis protein LarC [Candidatus Bathyarchaeota archaeon]|nr:nickel pincer cofactor biosynthesis protein LarC [Candidatus Bathyarchaeota archaeon]